MKHQGASLPWGIPAPHKGFSMRSCDKPLTWKAERLASCHGILGNSSKELEVWQSTRELFAHAFSIRPHWQRRMVENGREQPAHQVPCQVSPLKPQSGFCPTEGGLSYTCRSSSCRGGEERTQWPAGGAGRRTGQWPAGGAVRRQLASAKS